MYQCFLSSLFINHIRDMEEALVKNIIIAYQINFQNN